jgi:regulator of cell morphogenesis and NO signaling
MTHCTTDMSPVDWVIEIPQALAVFESLGIDYSCAGKSLEYVCRQQGFDVREVVARIEAASAQ